MTTFLLSGQYVDHFLQIAVVFAQLSKLGLQLNDLKFQGFFFGIQCIDGRLVWIRADVFGQVVAQRAEEVNAQSDGEFVQYAGLCASAPPHLSHRAGIAPRSAGYLGLGDACLPHGTIDQRPGVEAFRNLISAFWVVV